jgi:hypothetical protein
LVGGWGSNGDCGVRLTLGAADAMVSRETSAPDRKHLGRMIVTVFVTLFGSIAAFWLAQALLRRDCVRTPDLVCRRCGHSLAPSQSDCSECGVDLAAKPPRMRA